MYEAAKRGTQAVTARSRESAREGMVEVRVCARSQALLADASGWLAARAHHACNSGQSLLQCVGACLPPIQAKQKASRAAGGNMESMKAGVSQVAHPGAYVLYCGCPL